MILFDTMNKVETRENMGETAEDLVKMGVTDKKTSDWKMSGAELEEFKDTMLKQMGYPMTEAECKQEASRCLRCDHFGYGCFKGGREVIW